MIFTWYTLPDGKKSPKEINVSPEAQAKANELMKHGWRFEGEHLRTGDIHMDCCDEEGQLANFVLIPGSDIHIHAQKLVELAHKEWCQRGKPEASQ